MDFGRQHTHSQSKFMGCAFSSSPTGMGRSPPPRSGAHHSRSRPEAQRQLRRHSHNPSAHTERRGKTSLPQQSTPSSAAEDDVSERHLFSACLERDRWLSYLSGTRPWYAERSDALMRAHRKGNKRAEADEREGQHPRGILERVKVHRHGDLHTAIVLNSSIASVGDVMWTIDAREKTLSAFGQPGFGGMLLGSRPCVLLCDETDGAVVLYFYVDNVCHLRCWQRSKSAHALPRDMNTASSTDRSMSSSSDEGEHWRRAQRSSGGSTRPSGSTPKADLPRRGRHTSGARDHIRSSSTTSSTRIRNGPSSTALSMRDEDVEKLVARWAKGKDLAALLHELKTHFGRDFHSGSMELPSCEDAAMLRKQPTVLRRCYRRALLVTHPDKHQTSPSYLKTLASALFQALSAAHSKATAEEAKEAFAC